MYLALIISSVRIGGYSPHAVGTTKSLHDAEGRERCNRTELENESSTGRR